MAKFDVSNTLKRKVSLTQVKWQRNSVEKVVMFKG